MKAPTLTLILCTRNDTYMGNSRWRLQTVLNLTADNARKSGWLDRIEILVVDWGSENPLRNVIYLSSDAAKVTVFIEVPASLATEKTLDSPFPEVIALNTAVRRANGRFVGRIDNDTIVGPDFFRKFDDVLEKRINYRGDLEDTMFFVRRRRLPYEFAARAPSLACVVAATTHLRQFMMTEKLYPFFKSAVGIVLMSRGLWNACGGYDERLLYWGWMEVDLALRIQGLGARLVVDLGDLIGVDFFHLEHYDPRTPRKTNRKTNPEVPPTEPFPNACSWGLNGYDLTTAKGQPGVGDAAVALPGAIRVLCATPWTFVISGAAKSVILPIYCRVVPRPMRQIIGRLRRIGSSGFKNQTAARL